MLDAHAHVMQVKLCKANTRGVTPRVNILVYSMSTIGFIFCDGVTPFGEAFSFRSLVLPLADALFVTCHQLQPHGMHDCFVCNGGINRQLTFAINQRQASSSRAT